jgi:hypothetical protein
MACPGRSSFILKSGRSVDGATPPGTRSGMHQVTVGEHRFAGPSICVLLVILQQSTIPWRWHRYVIRTWTAQLE